MALLGVMMASWHYLEHPPRNRALRVSIFNR
jgi:hypothetical protein